jgi:hypothetical protein
MQVSFNKYPSEYDLQNEGYIPQNYPTHTISANNHTIKYLDDRNSKIYLVQDNEIKLRKKTESQRKSLYFEIISD